MPYYNTKHLNKKNDILNQLKVSRVLLLIFAWRVTWNFAYIPFN